MLRMIAVIGTIFAVQALFGGPARAGDEFSSFDSNSQSLRGLFVIRLPFGRTDSAYAPRVGFDFHMEQNPEFDYHKAHFDPDTGRRLPEVDAGGVRTWTLEGPAFTLPDDRRGEPEYKRADRQLWDAS